MSEDGSLNQFDDVIKNLEILKEECSEVIKVCCKISRFGFNDYNPDDSLKIINIEKLEKESGDILAMIDILVNNGVLTKSGLQNAKQSKFEKLSRYYHREGCLLKKITEQV